MQVSPENLPGTATLSEYFRSGSHRRNALCNVTLIITVASMYEYIFCGSFAAAVRTTACACITLTLIALRVV